MEEIWNATGMGETISHTTRYDSMADVSAVIGAAGTLFTIDLSGFALGYAATDFGVGENHVSNPGP